MTDYFDTLVATESVEFDVFASVSQCMDNCLQVFQKRMDYFDMMKATQSVAFDVAPFVI